MRKIYDISHRDSVYFEEEASRNLGIKEFKNVNKKHS